MSRRTHLIDAYLREHDPLGAAAPSRAIDAPSPVTGPRRRMRLLPALGGGLLAAASLAVGLVVAGAFTGADTRHDPLSRILSPQQAVAAVSDDLAHGSVLHWAWHEASGPDHDSGGTVRFENRSESWIDLTTGATHNRSTSQKFTNGKPSTGAGVSPETWSSISGTTWSQWSIYPRGFLVGIHDRRQVVMHTVHLGIRPVKTPVADRASPLYDVQALLRLAAQGKATLRDAGTDHGVPVVKVVEHKVLDARNPKRRVTASQYTWIVRSPQPRLLRYRLVGRINGRIAHVSNLVVDTWEMLPRTPQVLAHVQPPTFDPTVYKVQTQHLGPGSGKFKARDRASSR
ncbi:MAG: hypothetical protein REI11_01045 [Patulibacter sp.]|nr:hypothetical protein [Patulibacter sp.]